MEFLKLLSPDFQLVKGVYDLDSNIPISSVVQLDQLKIGFLNGFNIVPKNDPLSLLIQARQMDVDILIWGGTHRVEAYTLDGKFFVNPGSATGAFSTEEESDDEEEDEEVREDEEAPDAEADTEVDAEAGQEGEQQQDLQKESLIELEALEPIPSFCLLDVQGTVCTIYIYTYVDEAVKVDKVTFRKE